MKQILVVYYSQTGQLKRVIDTLIEPLQNEASFQVDYYQIKLKKKFPFPWNNKEFFDAFLYAVLEIPQQTTGFPENKDYDLILLAYQPWFLSPSIPITSFLTSPDAKKLFQNKKVITIIGCRNMWTQAQEKMKLRLLKLDARLIGNIVLFDRASNLISLFTIIRWMFYGKKGHSGISNRDIKYTRVYGKYLASCLLNNKDIEQSKLVSLGAVEVKNNLTMLEKRGAFIFEKAAELISKKSSPGSKKRAFMLKVFQIYLLLAIILFSPFTTFYGFLVRHLFPKKAEKNIKYYEGIK